VQKEERALRDEIRDLNKQHRADSRLSEYDAQIKALEEEIKKSENLILGFQQEGACEGLDELDSSSQDKIDELKSRLTTANELIHAFNRNNAQLESDFLGLESSLAMSKNIRNILGNYDVVVENLANNLRNAIPLEPTFDSDHLLSREGNLEHSHASIFESAFKDILSLANRLQSQLKK